MLKFTPTQQKIIDLLADGRPHTKEEIYAAIGYDDLCLEDDPVKAINLRNHVSKLRKILEPVGQDVVCISTGWSCRYQQVRTLHQCGDGRR